MVRLAPRWAKNNELSTLRTFYFRLEPRLLPGGGTGAAMKLCSRSEYDASWPLSRMEEEKRSEDVATMDQAALAETVKAVLAGYGAFPGSGLAHEWFEFSGGVPGHGGMGTTQLAEVVLQRQHAAAPTQVMIDAMVRRLQRHAGASLTPYVRARLGPKGVRWGLLVAP